MLQCRMREGYTIADPFVDPHARGGGLSDHPAPTGLHAHPFGR